MVRSSRFGAPTSAKWNVRRLNEASPLRGSNGIAFGPDGRLHVAQFLAGRISAVETATGRVEVVVPAAGPVRAPDDLAFGADGSMYVADITPGRVWRRSPDGQFSLISDQLRAPNGITCVGDRLFVNEMCPQGRVLELVPGRDPVVLAEGLALGNAMQQGPDGLLYYPHMVTGELWRVGIDGGAPELVATDLHEPVAARFDRAGRLVVLSRGEEGILTWLDPDTGAREVRRTGIPGMDNAAFDPDNRMLVSSYACGGIALVERASTRTVVPCGLSGPHGVVADGSGEVHAADHFRLASGELSTGGVLQQRTRGACHGVAAGGGLLHLTAATGEVRSFDPASGTARVRATGLVAPLGIAEFGGDLVVAESGAGRVVRIGADDAVSTLAELPRPVGVAVDAGGRCYVTDEYLGAVVAIDAGSVETIADGLDRPQGVALLGEEVFVVEVGARRLLSIAPSTGATGVEAEHLAVGGPIELERDTPAPQAFPPARPRAFAGIAGTPDGELLLSADGEGTVLRLAPRAET
ncbi:hypothetical protein [Saccharopolyspora griseoalba]|uniref:Gluconolaconase n=1 Tax=Saccharopolyspora griseoalba TaxID=1431848 RepID=A0ABW2LFZ1_9PSEU